MPDEQRDATNAIEHLGEKLFVLSDRLRDVGALGNDNVHAAYEAVVKAFETLSGVPSESEQHVPTDEAAVEPSSFGEFSRWWNCLSDTRRKDYFSTASAMRCFGDGWDTALRRRAAFRTPDPRPEIETLRRALVWHGDPVRMAKAREDWQQTIDEAVRWVNANPEDGRPSHPTFGMIDPRPEEIERVRAKAWQPIETAPKDGRYLIVGAFDGPEMLWVKDSHWTTGEQAAEEDGLTAAQGDDYETGWQNADAYNDGTCAPTHWMPLLEPARTAPATSDGRADTGEEKA